MKLFLFRKKELTPKMEEYLALKRKGHTQTEIAKMWNSTIWAVKKLSYRINKRTKTATQN